MTATGHAILGTVIAAKVGNPALAIPLALVSHAAADAFPHWDTATNIKKKGKERVLTDTVIDILVGFIISYLIVTFLFPATSLLYVFVLIIVAQFLDWITVPYYLFDIKFPLFIMAYKFQKKVDHTLREPWGIINQVAVLALIIALAKLF